MAGYAAELAAQAWGFKKYAEPLNDLVGQVTDQLLPAAEACRQ